MAIYNRYIKLQKYVNGEPRDEYKTGDLVDTVEWETLQGCENGEEWRKNGNTICEQPGTIITRSIPADTLPQTPIASDGCMMTENMTVTISADGSITSTGSKTQNPNGIFCEVKDYIGGGGTWNLGSLTDITCIDGNPFVAEVNSKTSEKRYTLNYFDVGSGAVSCYPVSEASKKWEDDNTVCHEQNSFIKQERYITSEDAMNILWGKIDTPTWSDTNISRYGEVYEYNVPDCGGRRSVITYSWKDPIVDGDEIPYQDFIKKFLEMMVHGNNGCYIPQTKIFTTSEYVYSDKYAGIQYQIGSTWTETQEKREGNSFDCTPFESSPDNRVIQWSLVDFDASNQDTYICENERTYRKMVSVTFTDDFGKTYVQYTEESKKGEEITSEHNLCESQYYIFEADYYTPSTYTQKVLSKAADIIEVTYGSYPDGGRTFNNTYTILGPAGISEMWEGNFHCKFYISKNLETPFDNLFMGNFNSRLYNVTSIDQELAYTGMNAGGEYPFFYINKNTNYWENSGTLSLRGWDTTLFDTTAKLESLFNYSSGGVWSCPKNIDVTGASAEFKALVRASALATKCTIIDND